MKLDKIPAITPAVPPNNSPAVEIDASRIETSVKIVDKALTPKKQIPIMICCK